MAVQMNKRHKSPFLEVKKVEGRSEDLPCSFNRPLS
jgi:hypothetical protein